MTPTHLGGYKLTQQQRERLAGYRRRWNAANARQATHLLRVTDRRMRDAGVLDAGLDAAKLTQAPKITPKIHITVGGAISAGTNIQPIPAPLPGGMVRRLHVEMGTGPTGGTLTVRFYLRDGGDLGTVTLAPGSLGGSYRIPGAGIRVNQGARCLLDAGGTGTSKGSDMTATVEVEGSTDTGAPAGR